jgi:hypothetical protein
MLIRRIVADGSFIVAQKNMHKNVKFLSLPGKSSAVNCISHCNIKAGYGQQDMQQVHESEGKQWEKKSEELLEKMWERLWCVGRWFIGWLVVG